MGFNNIRVEGQEVLVQLSRRIYSRSVVEKAVSDWNAVAGFRWIGHDLIAILPKRPEDVDLAGYEFCNYLAAVSVREK